MKLVGRIAAVAVCTGLAAWPPLARPRVAAAAPAPAENANTAAADPTQDAIAEAEALYDKGAAKFETADYAAAVDLWTQAYTLVPDTIEAGQIKALLIYNIATAHEKAFEIERDLAQLRKAKVLLQQFADAIEELYEGDAIETERAKVHERLAKIDAAIQHAEGDAEGSAEGDGAPPPGPGPTPEPTPPPGEPHPGRPLVITGAVLVGLGVAGLGMMGAGLAIGAGANDLGGLDDTDIQGRRDQFAKGRTGNALALAGGIGGGVLAVTGAVLLGIGVTKNKKAPSASAWLGPDGGGLGLRGRF